MTHRYDPEAPVLGTNLGTYRAVLAEWEARRDLACMPDAFGIPRDRVALIVDDAEARGMFGWLDAGDGYGMEYGALAPGRALLNAVTRPRMSPAEAGSLLDGLLNRAAALNADGDVPLAVDRIWLFGSLARGGAEHGDVDVVVELAEPPADAASRERHYGRLVDLALAMGREDDVAWSDDEGETASDIVAAALLFGRDGDPRLCAHPLRELLDLACPCRLVFDRSRGGRVREALTARHPGASGRAGTRVALEVPDMSAPAPLVPTAIALAGQWVAADPGIRGMRDGPRGLGPLHQPNHRAYEPRLLRWLEGLPAIDGRRMSVAADGRCFVDRHRPQAGPGTAALAFGRDIDLGSGIALNVVSAASFHGDEPTPGQVARLGAVMGRACALDAMKARQFAPGAPMPSVSLSAEGECPEWVGQALSAAEGHLSGLGLDCRLGGFAQALGSPRP